MKKTTKLFFRSAYISAVILVCVAIGTVGAAKAYENTLRTGFGEYKKAVDFHDGTLRIFDFEITIY